METESVRLYNKTVELQVFSAEDVMASKSTQVDAIIYGRLSQDEIKTRSLSKKVQRSEGRQKVIRDPWIPALERLRLVARNPENGGNRPYWTDQAGSADQQRMPLEHWKTETMHNLH